MKCSQCGCEDLVEVDFPQEVRLIEVDSGLAGYSSGYSLKNKVNCNTYICANCGHYEFFNKKLIEQIKNDKKAQVKVKDRTKKIYIIHQEINDPKQQTDNLINNAKENKD